MIETGENNPILRKKAEPILRITKEIKDLVAFMINELNHAKGIGLAAPQIGKSLRLIICKEDRKNDKTHVFINPVIKKQSKETNIIEEGCLSLPGLVGVVERPESIVIEAKNEFGKKVKMKLTNLLARVFQHEYDHLEGILYIDRASKIIKTESKS
jgi:peptide deformylase